MKIRTRFAPSPTGSLHIGSLRTALYSYVFAKSQSGKFILRIEDTDLKRLVPKATEGIYQMLKKFGIAWDEGPLVGGPHQPYIQSGRVKSGLYRQYAEKLVSDGRAYYCCCPPESLSEIEKRHQKGKVDLRDPCRKLGVEAVKAKTQKGKSLAVRLKIPDNETVSYHDFVLKKEVSWETENVDEVMLLKSDGYPTYHLGVVVDDALMKVSHIIRGRDWLPSTPVHLLLYRYLGFSLPQIGHLTDILDPAGGKLSKRKGSVTCEEFLEQGYLPEAILNFIMLLGWAPKNDREFFSLEEFVKEFQKGELHVANPVFNRKKLDWFNGMYIRKKSENELLQLIKPFIPRGMDGSLAKKVLPLVKDRLRKLSEFSELTDFFIKKPKVDPKLIVQKDKTKSVTKAALSTISNQLSAINGVDWRFENLEKIIRKYHAEKLADWSTGQLFMTLRIAVTGRKATPPLFETMEVLGKEKTLKRLQKASQVL
ncbi:glutamate--tRNA ligase [Patescibacteria group bacterium]